MLTRRTRFVQSTIPYVLPDGTRVADDWSDLTDGTIAAAINVLADGTAPNGLPTTVFTNANADVGRGHFQLTSGAIRLSYVASQYFMATISLSSQQPWKTADNKSYRFPFFDFESTANNFTFIGTSISGFY